MAITADMDRIMVGIEPADRRLFLWGLVASAVLHALVALMLMEGVSGYTTKPLQDVVEVELLPPPPQEEETPPPEVQQPEPEQPEQEEVETPEQPEPPEQEQAEEAPPPPPPPPAPAPQDLAETPEPPAEPSVLQEVTEFGEEDTGLQGEEETPPASAESATSDGEQQAEADAQTDDAQTDDAQAGETDAGEGEGEGEGQETETAETDAPQQDAPDGAQEAAPQETSEETPEESSEDTPDESDAADEASDVAETPEQPDALPEETAGTGAETDTAETGEQLAEDFGIVGPIATNKTPAPKPPKPVASPQRDQGGGRQASGGSEGPPAGMIAARELYSRDILDDPQARTAMRGMSEGQRLNLLCMTELREQIASVSALPPELLPSFRPRGGNVLQPRIAAFRSLGRWFDVAFRCETDAGVTRVERFSFKIGNEIPRSQWLQRGLTGF
ncbi:DUF930 domain-containing protein [Roseibium sp. LAB1]